MFSSRHQSADIEWKDPSWHIVTSKIGGCTIQFIWNVNGLPWTACCSSPHPSAKGCLPQCMKSSCVHLSKHSWMSRGCCLCRFVLTYAQIETDQFFWKGRFSSPWVYAYQLHACTQQTHAISTDVWCFEPKGQAKQQIQFYRIQFSLD